MAKKRLSWKLGGGALACGAVLGACGGPAVPAVTSEAAMESTFAGSNKCEADSHDRPFIIEWDATDIARFENRAAKDVVFVRYEGCELEVIDGCSDDALPGRYGTYSPPQWTSGSVEKMSIDNTAELAAKLPLGVATLSGKVERGVKLEMHYHVSGVATATRDVMHRGNLKQNDACAKATHFVYAYNLGAFRVDSLETGADSAGADVKGVGVSGESTRSTKSEKSSGDISKCTGTTALDTDKCKVPIRLSLRKLQPGKGPEIEAANDADQAVADKPPDIEGTPMMVAGKLRNDAGEKAKNRDGKGCLALLDKADKIDPDPSRISTNPKALLHLRAGCEMLAGDCKSGRAHLTAARQVQAPGVSAKIIDNMVSTTAKMMCPVSQLNPWERLDVLTGDASRAASGKDIVKCESAATALLKELKQVGTPSDFDQKRVKEGAANQLLRAGQCVARLGKCAAGKKLALEATKRGRNPNAAKEPGFTKGWERRLKACVGK